MAVIRLLLINEDSYFDIANYVMRAPTKPPWWTR